MVNSIPTMRTSQGGTTSASFTRGGRSSRRSRFSSFRCCFSAFLAALASFNSCLWALRFSFSASRSIFLAGGASYRFPAENFSFGRRFVSSVRGFFTGMMRVTSCSFSGLRGAFFVLSGAAAFGGRIRRTGAAFFFFSASWRRYLSAKCVMGSPSGVKAGSAGVSEGAEGAGSGVSGNRLSMEEAEGESSENSERMESSS